MRKAVLGQLDRSGGGALPRVLLYIHTAMQITLYALRENGRPRSYAEIKAQPLPRGTLVLGTWGNPEEHAKLFGEWPEMKAPRLEHARVTRISSDCILMMGFEPSAYLPLPRQTWLCALNERAGEAALRKLRPPRPGDLPFGDLDADHDDYED